MEHVTPLHLGLVAAALFLLLLARWCVVPVVVHLLGMLVARIRSRRHPQPIAGWARTALALLDDGGLWLDEPPRTARYALRTSWNINHVGHWASETQELVCRSGPIDAWDGLRAIRITHQAACAGWIPEADAWALTVAVARELQCSYAGFGDLARDYQRAYRRWAGLPEDGSGDDPECRRRARAIGRLEASGWHGTDFAQHLAFPNGRAYDRAFVTWLLDTTRAHHDPRRVAVKNAPLAFGPWPQQ